MSKLFKNQKVNQLWGILRPWLSVLALLIILRYTGALSGISYLTGNILMKTGAMDIELNGTSGEKNFNYNFSIQDLEGNAIDFKQFKGKVVFLNLWATWCGPCRIEMPSIQSLHDKIKDDRIAFVMLSLDRDEQKEKVKQYIQKESFSFPVYMMSGNVPTQLHVGSIPTTFVIRPDGKIVSQRTGVTNFDTEDFKAFLEKLAETE